MFRTSMLLFLIVIGLSLPSFAAIVYDESIDGNFSDSRLTPTVVAVGEGSNQILGTNGSGASAVRDYFRINIPVGLMLSSITLLDTTLGARGFLGVQAGDEISLLPSTTTAAGLLGWWHYVPDDKGTDILMLMATPANGSSGFTPPLPAGDYTFWVQDSSPGVFNYGFNLQVEPVPEPATWGLSLVAIAGFVLSRRSRRRQSSQA